MATLKLQSMSRRTRLAFVLLLALAPLPLLLWRAMPARAADFVVTSCTMQGVADVLNANTSANISFNCGGPATITFTQPGGLNVLANQSFTIDGGDVITLSGLQTYRLFDVQAGGALTLTHIVLADGYATVGGNLPTQGGALLAEGNLLVLDHATVRRSVSSFAGGAIEVATGTAILLDSLIEDNQSDYGGGIDSIGALTLIRTTVRSNHALTHRGGGLDVGGTVVIRDSQIVSNTADANNGGGMYVAIRGTVTADGSLFASNLATGTTTLDGGGIYNQGTLTLTHVTLSGNRTGGGNGPGLYVDSTGRADIADSRIISNSAPITPTTPAGGGIYNASSLLTIRQTLLSGNAAYAGGGIFNAGIVTLTNVSLSENAAHHGGGIDNIGGTAALADVTISGNPASTDGGGIYNFGVMTLTNVTLSGNSAPGGGGIYNIGGLTLTNATLSGNAATDGGGIFNDGTAMLTNATLSGNSGTNGGGIYQRGAVGSKSTSLKNSIVANSPSGGNCHLASGAIISLGYNLSSDTSCQAYLNQLTDLPPSTDPNLGPLANNGGPTLTHLPLTPDSPGIDVIPKFTNGCGTTINTDQRGAPRPLNGKCDIGAVEYGWAYPRLWLPLVVR